MIMTINKDYLEPCIIPKIRKIIHAITNFVFGIYIVSTVSPISKNFQIVTKLFCINDLQVTKLKKWREISGALNIGTSSSAGFTLKKNYCRLIFPFECKFELGNIDPSPILAQVEAPQKKDSKRGTSPAKGNYRSGGFCFFFNASCFSGLL